MRHRKHLSAARAEEIRSRLGKSGEQRVAGVIERNIELIEFVQVEADRHRSPQDRAADAITAFSGSMAFVYIHLGWFVLWGALNLGWIPGMRPFDPYPFQFLTMVVSLEAIFLSTFVLISQNRQAASTDQREALDLQIDLLAEYEVTRMLRLVDKMASKMGVEDVDRDEIRQLCEPVAPDVILREIANRHGIDPSKPQTQ